MISNVQQVFGGLPVTVYHRRMEMDSEVISGVVLPSDNFALPVSLYIRYSCLVELPNLERFRLCD
jgi:hypothetical protein